MSARRKIVFPDHAGKATWGERVVPLSEFEAEVASHGRELDDEAGAAAIRAFVEPADDETPLEGPFERIVVFGGVYNNHLALARLLEEARAHEAQAVYCLGDLGGFGPHPGKVPPLLQEAGVRVIQGNYEESLAAGAEDCNCGYTDPRDNHFAALSYEYTARGCPKEHREWMGGLPRRRRVRVGQRELLLVHGSPRQINEFLFESTTSTPFLERLLEQEQADAVLCTHTGLPWHRRLPSGRDAVNVGVIGRPANDGRPDVRYAVLDSAEGELRVDLRRLAYDHDALADEMRSERLPEEFVETILTGWWTTCLEILPAKERSASRY